MTYHATGIVLRREAWRENARLYTIYTREAGKVLAVGRGTRKILSKLAAHLEPYSSVEVLLARGRKTEVVCGAAMIRSPEALAADERRHMAAAFVAETVDQLVKMGDRDEELWRMLEDFYASLAESSAEWISRGVAAFLWRFMAQLGYRPKLEECSECGRDVRAEIVRFMPIRGTAVCRACPLPERELVGAVLMSAAVPTFAGALSFLEAHLDRPLASLPLVKSLLLLGAGAHKVLSFQRKLEPSTEKHI